MRYGGLFFTGFILWVIYVVIKSNTGEAKRMFERRQAARIAKEKRLRNLRY